MNDRIFEYLESFGDDEIATWSIGFDEWWNRWCDKLNLPHTGGHIFMFAILGGVLLIGAGAFIYKKRKHFSL